MIIIKWKKEQFRKKMMTENTNSYNCSQTFTNEVLNFVIK